METRFHCLCVRSSVPVLEGGHSLGSKLDSKLGFRNDPLSTMSQERLSDLNIFCVDNYVMRLKRVLRSLTFK